MSEASRLQRRKLLLPAFCVDVDHFAVASHSFILVKPASMVSRLVANDMRAKPSVPNAAPWIMFTWACSRSAAQNDCESVTFLSPKVFPKYDDTSKKA